MTRLKAHFERWLPALMLAAAMSAPAMPALAQPAPAAPSGEMLHVRDGKSYFSLDMPDTVKYTVLLLMKPDRLVVTLRGNSIMRSSLDRLMTDELPSESGITNIAIDGPNAGATRISFGLAYLPSTFESHVEAAPNGMRRLVVEWGRAGVSSASASKPSAASAATSAATPKVESGAPAQVPAVAVASATTSAPTVLSAPPVDATHASAPSAVAGQAASPVVAATSATQPVAATTPATVSKAAPESVPQAKVANGTAMPAVQQAHQDAQPQAAKPAAAAARASDVSPAVAAVVKAEAAAAAAEGETARTAPVDSSDMMSIFQDAQRHDSAYASARAAFEAAKEKAPQGFARLLPAIGLSANTAFNRSNVTYNPCTNALPCGQENYNTNSYTFSFSQPIFQMQNFIQWNEDELQVAAAQSQFFAAKQDLIMKCAEKYFDVLVAQSYFDMVRVQKKSAYEQLEQTKLKKEVGAATETDIQDAQAKLDSASSQEMSAASDLEIKRRTLEVLTGKVPGQLNMLGANFVPHAPRPLDIEKWVDAAKTNNYQVLVHEALEAAAEREIDKNKAGNYPTVNLVGSVGKNAAGANAYNTSASVVSSNSVGLQLNFPIYQGGEISSKVREAVANRDKAQQDLESARRAASLEARQSYFGVTDGIAQIKALEQAVASSKSFLDAATSGAEIGVYTKVDVLGAEQRYYSAKRELYQARYKYLVSVLKLKATTGSLNETDIEEISRAMH